MPIEWTGSVQELPAKIEFDPDTGELTIRIAGRVHSRLELDHGARQRLAKRLLFGLPRPGS